ncbi:MAG: hypothetical protein NVS2B4_00020 [Ramlibacter sp.]
MQRQLRCSNKLGSQRGFTLVELMVGVVIGLFASLAVTQVLINAEGQKRTTTSASDAQVSGALALDTLARAIQPAGYGFGVNPNALGCQLSGGHTSGLTFQTVASPTSAAVEAATFPSTQALPAVLVPVVILQGANGAPDAIRVLASGKRSLSLPIRVVAPGYVAGNASFPVVTTLSVDGPQPNGASPTVPGELLVAVKDGTPPCEVFQVTDPPTSGAIPRANGTWNAVNSPAQTYSDGDYLLNLGVPVDRTFSIVNNSLRQNVLQIAANGVPTYSGAMELFSGIVSMKAQYGKDTNADGAVDAWDNITPTTNALWRQVIAIRVVAVARSGNYEKGPVTFNCPSWVGSPVKIPGSSTCSPGTTIDEPWMHYRYKSFDTLVPLRNLLWNS